MSEAAVDFAVPGMAGFNLPPPGTSPGTPLVVTNGQGNGNIAGTNGNTNNGVSVVSGAVSWLALALCMGTALLM